MHLGYSRADVEAKGKASVSRYSKLAADAPKAFKNRMNLNMIPNRTAPKRNPCSQTRNEPRTALAGPCHPPVLSRHLLCRIACDIQADFGRLVH
jgi:hypothetical protein